MPIVLRSPFISKTNAARQAVKLLVKNYSIPTPIPERGTITPGNYFYRMSGLAASKFNIDCRTYQGQSDAYQTCSPVASIVGKLADMSRQARFVVEDENGEEIQKPRSSFLLIRSKPNPLQSWDDFFMQLYTYRKVHGKAYVYAVSPTGLNDSVRLLWVIPNIFVTENLTFKRWYQTELGQIIADYTVTGMQRNIPANEMIVFYDSATSMNVASTTEAMPGQSRLYACSDQVNNINRAYEARRTLLEKPGMWGAWVNDNPKDTAGINPLLEPEKEVIQQALAQYGLTLESKIPPVFSTPMKWVQAGYPTKDLELFSEIKDDILRLADAFNFPSYLLGDKEGTTFTNLNEAIKHVYSTVVIQDVQSILNTFSNFFNLEKYGERITAYFDHLEIFQRNNEQEANAINTVASALDVFLKGRVMTVEEARKFLYEFLPVGYSFDPDKVYGKTYLNELTA